ncbi:glycosyltransferase family 4 protein [Agromyces larvae]|uniref:Glycosyltransferase family 4 protein n=1 Tax=Agromyces larvae TaxID=2929802 RepID=A0ABY4C6J5_9MICO|nr:glycosyltransferase family 4 protein [Agromyces larvae]UOE44335.1 glycosyltransferase family 4 protein [Agromyces larvae]
MTDVTRRPRDQDRLRILYSFPHPIGAPGIGWTASNQVAELVAAGHEVHLVAAAVDRPVDGVASLTRTMTVGGRRVPHALLGGDRAYSWHDRRAAARLRAVRPDVVHGWPLASLRTFELARDLGIAAVREAPNTHTAHAYAVVARELAALGIELPQRATHAFNASRLAIEQREWDAATGVLVPSTAVERTFLDRGFPRARLLRHRYGARPDAVPARRDDPGRPFTAVFVGRCEPRKGLHHALRAWLSSTASQHGRLLVYGEFVPAYRDVLRDQLDHPSVECLGFSDAPAHVFAEADVLVLPTLEEGSALVTYEAQLAGCVPLVSSAAGAVIEHGVHGLVHEPGEVAALVGHLDRLSTDPDELARLRAGALAHADDLTWAAANVALVAAYRAARDLVAAGAPVARREPGAAPEPVADEASGARPSAAEGAAHARAD